MSHPQKKRNPRASEPTVSSAHIPKHHYFHTLLLFIILIAVAVYSGETLITDVISLTLIVALVVFTATRYVMAKKQTTIQSQYALASIDGVFVAWVIATIHFSPAISIVILALLYFNTVYSDTTKHCWALTIGLILGAASSFFLLNITLDSFLSNIIENIAPISLFSTIVAIGALWFLSVYARFIRKQSQDIDINNGLLTKEIKQQKLRIYELSQHIPTDAKLQLENKKKPKIERKPITVFFSDIVGFSSLSEELEAETLANVLSSYLVEMSTIVGQYNGTIDKFIGDAIMVTFGDNTTNTQGVKKDAIACVSMAIAMGKRMRELQSTWAEMGIKKPLQIRMGINSGYCTVGAFGTSQHLDYTALGVHVNLASRLESAGKPEDILISHETWSLVNDTILCKDRGQIKAKGFTHPVQVYQVINYRKELGGNQSYFSQTTDGFSMHLDMEKVKNYDQEKVIKSLEQATKKIKEKFHKQ